MSIVTLEREIVAAARVVLKNPKLRNKDVMEWSTTIIKPKTGETTINTGKPLSIYVTVKKEMDKRK